MLLPREKIVNLEQVEARDAPLRLDSSICPGPAFAEEIQTLSAEKRPEGLPILPQTVADHRLRRAIHGRTVDHPAARLEERAHDLGALLAQHGSSPTLNVIQVPRPTTGSRSPVEGILRNPGPTDSATHAAGLR